MLGKTVAVFSSTIFASSLYLTLFLSQSTLDHELLCGWTHLASTNVVLLHEFGWVLVVFNVTTSTNRLVYRRERNLISKKQVHNMNRMGFKPSTKSKELTIASKSENVIRQSGSHFDWSRKYLVLVGTEVVPLAMHNRSVISPGQTKSSIQMNSTHPKTANMVRMASGSVASHLFSPAAWYVATRGHGYQRPSIDSRG